MNLKHTINILTFIPLLSNATNYYVSNAGNDSNSGMIGSPFATLFKALSVVVSGDRILLNRGDTFYVTSKSIIPDNNISILDYGVGAKPIITALQTVSMGSPSNNIYTIVASSAAPNLKIVLVNGGIKAKGRTPNSGYSVFTGGTDSTLTGTGLTGTPDYTGSEIVVRPTTWVIDVTKVKSQATSTLTLSPKLTYAGITFGGNGYFFQNKLSYLDQDYEWSFDSSTKSFSLYYSSTPIVQISASDTLIWVNKKSNISFSHIIFSGANKTAFQIDTTTNLYFDSCEIMYCNNAFTGYKNRSFVFDSGIISYCLNGAFVMNVPPSFSPSISDSNYSNPKDTVSNTSIKNIAIYAGMGESGDNKYFGLRIDGDSCYYFNNRIDSVGYIPFMWTGKKCTIKNNYITNYGFVKTDAGGIYSTIGTSSVFYLPDSGSLIKNNIVGSATSPATAGTTGAAFNGLSAIYMDDNVADISIEGNTTFFTNNAGIFLHGVHGTTIRGNTLTDSLGYDLGSINSNNPTSNLTIRSNIYYARKNTINTVNYSSATVTQTSDSNYYLRPTAPSNQITYGASSYDFPTFQSSTGYDTNGSATMPSRITSNVGELLINPTQRDSTFLLSKQYKDINGNVYYNSMTIHPFQSFLLFPIPSFYSNSPYFYLAQ